MKRWTQEEDDELRRMYSLMTTMQLSTHIGRSQRAVANRCWVLNLNSKASVVDEWKVVVILWWYERHTSGPFRLSDLADAVGMDKANVARVARRHGLTNNRRKTGTKKRRRKFETTEELRKHQSEAAKERIRRNGHPRGMLGKKHSDKTKRQIAKNGYFSTLTREQRREMAKKTVATRIERYGSGGPANIKNLYSRCRGGKRVDLGESYFRSRWEANYARFLNLLIERGSVSSWEYEPDTFVFEGIKRGCMTYTPDFKVVFPDGVVEYHEVKGWMDKRSKTKLRRMGKYHPTVSVVVIGEKSYRDLERKWSSAIDNWE